jgi:hypothetical protein
VDLIVSFEDATNEDIPGPPVRYFFGVWTYMTRGLYERVNKLSNATFFYSLDYKSADHDFRKTE